MKVFVKKYVITEENCPRIKQDFEGQFVFESPAHEQTFREKLVAQYRNWLKCPNVQPKFC